MISNRKVHFRRKSNSKKQAKVIRHKLQIYKTSFRLQTKLFFEHSTLHGVRYIAEKGRPFLEKFMWFACVAIGTVATTIIIVSLWEKFQTNPTITGLDTDFHNWDVSFPAITACQQTPGNQSYIAAYATKYSEKLGISADALHELLVLLTQLSYDSIDDFSSKLKLGEGMFDVLTIKQLAFQLMNKCEDVFDVCYYKSVVFDCCDEFHPIFTERGFCYAFNSRHQEDGSQVFVLKKIKETDIDWALKFSVRDTSVNMPIYILNSDETASLDVEPQHIWDFKVKRISFSVKQTYTTQDTRQLSIKQRHCIFSDEIKLAIDDKYSYTACTMQCRMDNSMKYCNCVPHFYPDRGLYRHCQTVSEFFCLKANLKAIEDVNRCSCHLGCANTVYEVEKLNEINLELTKNDLEIRFVSWPMIRYKREVLFGWVDLLVSFGGIAGLFLGFSLLSGVEILYYFTIRAFCMVIREKDELERIQLEEKMKPPPEYDLSLVPYFISKPLPGAGLNQLTKSYYQTNLYNNKIVPLAGKKLGKNNILPPFGIEFAN